MTVKQSQQSPLIASLLKPDAYLHPTESIELLETHISWVILTGTYAYKIKKPVNLGFVDFSTLPKRKFFCEEELRLNGRLAPMLYLDVVPICGSVERPVVGGTGSAIEYAVKMLQFPQSAQLDKQLNAGLLSEGDMEALAETIARYHQDAEVVAFEGAGEALELAGAPMRDNFIPIEQSVDMRTVRLIRAWTEDSLKQCEQALIERHKNGFIRECHGDLHLANLVRLPEAIVAFDCIEFNPDLRAIDVISDIAFLAMDLVARARQDLAAIVLNRYLERSGDYAGMAVFGLYFVYHAMIRAKVAAVRSQEIADTVEREHELEQLKHYLAVALRWIKRPKPLLIATHGFSGSGKTWLSGQLISQIPAIRVRSDIERKRMQGLKERARTRAKPGEGAYSDRARRQVYENLMVIVRELLTAGYTVIADASFLKREDRQLLEAEAVRCDVPLVIVHAHASDKELNRRLRERDASGSDASEATVDVLAYQREHADALSDEERARTVCIATDSAIEMDAIIKAIKRASAHPVMQREFV